MKPRIALIIERADTTLGGAERSIFELAGAISLLDCDVHILAAKGHAQTKNIHILCTHLPGKRTGLAAFRNALKKHLYQNRYDIIHSILPFDFADIYQPRGGTYAESIIRNAATYESGLVRTLKNLFACANIKRTILLRSERKLASKTDGPQIVAISQYVARQFQQHYGTSPGRITVIPNGVKTDLLSNKTETDNLRRHILTTLHLKEADEPVLFLFAGNDFRRKGLAPLIKALRVISSENPKSSAYLVVAGHRDIPRYHKLSAKLNVAGRVVFLGNLSHIHNALAVTDVAVLPTFQDACSRFILEALAAGRPVITTRFNGATDLFTDNRHGKIIDDPRNITALAAAIGYYTDPANIRAASDAIIEDNLISKISVTRVARELKALYDQIIEQRKQQ
jgi:UDP-glucose:(heptosyl)LPS alpha-1,3-glucosyltransferase